MRAILLFLLIHLCLINVTAAQQTTSSRINSLKQEIESLKGANAETAKQFEDLRAQVAAANNSLAEHRYKEALYGDLIGTNVSWFAVVIGLIGATFGLISWKRYNTVDSLMASTVTKLNAQFDAAIKKHQQEEEIVFEKIGRDRIILRRDLGNAYVGIKAATSDKLINLSLSLFLLRCDECEYEFMASLSKQGRENVMSLSGPKTLLKRLNTFERELKEFMSASLKLSPEFINRFRNLFVDLRFWDQLENKDKVKALHRQIIVKVENYWEEQNAAAKAELKSKS
ncbi:hypothetical protein [uncultured Alistipes sp.]|uniref:hypothetical protein n=1 Tax=uncultured Alistipes sp. TaxID=538949 RepID=UPI0025E9A064|nr:hypothetical protein [uncultured Alistipes sp.]